MRSSALNSNSPRDLAPLEFDPIEIYFRNKKNLSKFRPQDDIITYAFLGWGGISFIVLVLLLLIKGEEARILIFVPWGILTCILGLVFIGIVIRKVYLKAHVDTHEAVSFREQVDRKIAISFKEAPKAEREDWIKRLDSESKRFVQREKLVLLVTGPLVVILVWLISSSFGLDNQAKLLSAVVTFFFYSANIPVSFAYLEDLEEVKLALEKSLQAEGESPPISDLWCFEGQVCFNHVQKYDQSVTNSRLATAEEFNQSRFKTIGLSSYFPALIPGSYVCLKEGLFVIGKRMELIPLTSPHQELLLNFEGNERIKKLLEES